MSYEETKLWDGSFDREWRTEDGKFHREDGPAIIWYYPNGSIKREYFYIDGKFHRELGPAVICYNGDGSIKIERFYLNGEYLDYNKKGFWKLWDNLTEEQRRNPELLKCLARFS
jgi:antitoxin component YwqK of YwqJK toxin-antitoxin module